MLIDDLATNVSQQKLCSGFQVIVPFTPGDDPDELDDFQLDSRFKLAKSYLKTRQYIEAYFQVCIDLFC